MRSHTTAVVLFALFASVIGTSLEEIQYRQWKIEHNRFYNTPEEDNYRFGVFKDNLKKIEEMNAKYPDAKFGMNKFGDLPSEEFAKKYMSPIPAVRNPTDPVAREYTDAELQDLPESFDWRPKGAVTPVKNQGMCGSCWAFSATGNIEGQWKLAGHDLVGLSEQNLVDCDHECMTYEGYKTCDEGCNGGLMPNAYNYVIHNGGIDTEKSYPYAGYDGTCSFKPADVGAKISNYTMISQNETQMAKYLVEHGPISIAADAEAWQFYIGGVFYLPCGTTLNHGILIVGYDVETDIFGRRMPYWIIKNSWGESWGYDGYIYVERGNGRCGVNLFASSVIV